MAPRGQRVARGGAAERERPRVAMALDDAPHSRVPAAHEREHSREDASQERRALSASRARADRIVTYVHCAVERRGGGDERRMAGARAHGVGRGWTIGVVGFGGGRTANVHCSNGGPVSREGGRVHARGVDSGKTREEAAAEDVAAHPQLRGHVDKRGHGEQ